MKIQIKTLKGDMFPIEAAETDSVLNLKEKIADSKSDSPVERQKLIHSGKVLKDEQTIAELGITEADFIVCMLTKEVAKKAAPTPAPAAPAPIQAAPATPIAPPAPVVAPGAPIQPPQAPQAPQAPQSPAVDLGAQFVTADALAALTGMGFPEGESRAALAAAMGNPDLAYEFLLTGIPERARAPARTAASPMAPVAPAAAAPQAGGIEQLRRHPQFNMLKNLIQQNPASLPQVLDLIGQQDPALLAAIHANNDAFIAMMNEPITETPAAAPAAPIAPAAGMANPMADPAQVVQMLGAMPPAQRAQFAQSMGMTPAQLEGFMQLMQQMPPDELQQMMGGAMGAMGGGGGAAGGHHHGGQNVIRLTEDEMAAVNRLMGLGFSQQEAAQAYLACDKNEELAANFLFEGGFMDDGEDDEMYH